MITVVHLNSPAAVERALAKALARLATTRPEAYRREVDFRRVRTARLHKVRRLEKLLDDHRG